MPSRKEVEREVAKINKEIAALKWSLKNDVLTPHQRDVKINKIKDLRKTRKELIDSVEGWKVKTSKKTISKYGYR